MYWGEEYKGITMSATRNPTCERVKNHSKLKTTQFYGCPCTEDSMTNASNKSV